jgi:hypothetical protein
MRAVVEEVSPHAAAHLIKGATIRGRADPTLRFVADLDEVVVVEEEAVVELELSRLEEVVLPPAPDEVACAAEAASRKKTSPGTNRSGLTNPTTAKLVGQAKRSLLQPYRPHLKTLRNTTTQSNLLLEHPQWVTLSLHSYFGIREFYFLR